MAQLYHEGRGVIIGRGRMRTTWILMCVWRLAQKKLIRNSMADICALLRLNTTHHKNPPQQYAEVAAMNQMPATLLEQARADLHKAEANRSDPRRRGLFWNAKTWDETFKKITGLEDNRDYNIQQQLDQARKSGQIDRILTLLQHYYEYIDADAAWYKAHEDGMRDLRERWETYQVAEASAINQLASHYAQIAYR